MSLKGQIAVVTGASRGIGRGIALQLGEAGATVYVTGRSPSKSDQAKMGFLPGLEQAAQEITDRGGKGIAVYVDHSDMDDVKKFFENIDKDHNGQLDILVNNAYSAVTVISSNIGKPFYECPPEMWDDVNNVGLRNHYYCSVYASRIMVKNNRGLIVNVSSCGGLKYIFNVPYGVGKQALDRLSADMAVELKKNNVCVVSLWPGPVRTELIVAAYKDNKDEKKQHTADRFMNGETVEYPGIALVELANDDKRMNLTGRTLITQDLASRYGFVDIDGRDPPNFRSLWYLLDLAGYKRTASWIPAWVKVPGWALWGMNSNL